MFVKNLLHRQTFMLITVIPVVMKSLLYEEKRGTNTYGSMLRDAACYVCWSFARAFEPHDIQPHVSEIAKYVSILLVCFFNLFIFLFICSFNEVAK